MQVQLAILELYPDLLPDPFGPDFSVVDNELVQWNTELYPKPTREELEGAWLSAVKKIKVEEFGEQAKTLAGGIWLDAMVELASAPRSGALPPQPKVQALKDVHARLGRGRQAAQSVSPAQHDGDPLKAAKAVESLTWETL